MSHYEEDIQYFRLTISTVYWDEERQAQGEHDKLISPQWPSWLAFFLFLWQSFHFMQKVNDKFWELKTEDSDFSWGAANSQKPEDIQFKLTQKN